MPIKSKIRAIPDYPKKGIMFRDITTLIKNPVAFRLVIDNFTQRYIQGHIKVDAIVSSVLLRDVHQQNTCNFFAPST